MDDTIYRQAAIDVEGIDEQIRCEMCRNPMHTDRGCDGNCKYDEKLYERIMQILDERIKPLPSAQPERKRGKWTHERLASTTGGTYPVTRCSECKNAMPFEWEAHYCPNCGAYMGEDT